VFASGYMSGIYATWLPAYLEIERHMSITKAGMIATIPFAMSVVGSLFAGWAADALGHRGVMPLNRGRIVFVTGLVGLALFTALAAQSNSTVIALTWISTAMFFVQLAGSCSWVSASAAVPENCLGSFGGIMNCFGYISGAIAPAVTGIAVDITGSFAMPLVLGAAIALAGGAVFWFLPTRPITAEDVAGRTRLAVS
jgi:MFS family permease